MAVTRLRPKVQILARLRPEKKNGDSSDCVPKNLIKNEIHYCLYPKCSLQRASAATSNTTKSSILSLHVHENRYRSGSSTTYER